MAPGVVAKYIPRLRQALPSPAFAIGGSLAWAAAMAASASLALVLRGWSGAPAIFAVAAMFFAGGLMAFAPAAATARLVKVRPHQPAFAASILSLAVFTIVATALINGLVFRLYFSTWHAPVTTRLGANEFVFTVASGGYQFLVLGLRLMLPAGLPALLLAAWLIVRTSSAKSLNPARDSG